MTIPFQLWQTYKSHSLPPQAIHSTQTWKSKNPNLIQSLYDDAQCDSFIKENFNSDFYNMYKSLPFGVMRADVWRVAIVYIFGGIYADTDTDCKVPITTWLDPSDKLIIVIENPNGSLANFLFAAEPKHPALKSVLDTFLDLYNSPQFMERTSKTPIQNFGQHGFHQGILSYYNLHDNESMTKGGNSNYYNEMVEGTGTKFMLQQDQRFTNGYKPSSYVVHAVASSTWGGNYPSWREHQKAFFNK